MLGVSSDLSISQQLSISWSFQGSEITFAVPRKSRTICSLREVCKSLCRNIYNIWVREKSIQHIRDGMVVKVKHDDSLAWFFPDIPWQLFSRTGSRSTIPRYGIYGIGDYKSFGLTPWSLTPYKEGTHVCIYDIPHWILNNEEEADRSFDGMERILDERKRTVRSKDSKPLWDAKCRGWYVRSRKKNYLVAKIPEKREENDLIIKIHKTDTVLFRTPIPEVIEQRSEFFYKKRGKKTVFSFNEKTASYFLNRDIIEIHPSVEPIDLIDFLALPKSWVKKLVYRRIGEVPEEILVRLRDILLPELLCLEGDWTPRPTVEKVFGPEIWHPSSKPQNEFARVCNEIYYLGGWRQNGFGYKNVNAFAMLSILRGEEWGSNGRYIFPPNGWEYPHV